MTEPPGLREQKKLQTRLAIARAALALANEHGYDQITVAEIAERAGVSRRTISNYFPSKAECFAGAIDHRIFLHIAHEVLAEADGSVSDRLAQAFTRIDQQFWTDAAAVHRIAQQHPEVAAVVALAEQRQGSVIIEQLEALSEGRLDRLRLSATIGAITGCVSACVAHWLAAGGIGSPRELASMVASSIDVLDLSWLDPHIDVLQRIHQTGLDLDLGH